MVNLALQFPTSTSEVGPVVLSVLMAAAVLALLYGLYRVFRAAARKRRGR